MRCRLGPFLASSGAFLRDGLGVGRGCGFRVPGGSWSVVSHLSSPWSLSSCSVLVIAIARPGSHEGEICFGSA
jgi:hypothetical protein